MRNKEQKTEATFLEEIMDICFKATDGIIVKERPDNSNYVNGLIKSSRRASQQAKAYNRNNY